LVEGGYAWGVGTTQIDPLDEPDRRTTFEHPTGTYVVDMWRGPFRSRLVTWKDVRPALGGLLGQMRCRNRHADAAYDILVNRVRETLS
jgi:hypothetical protein